MKRGLEIRVTGFLREEQIVQYLAQPWRKLMEIQGNSVLHMEDHIGKFS